MIFKLGTNNWNKLTMKKSYEQLNHGQTYRLLILKRSLQRRKSFRLPSLQQKRSRRSRTQSIGCSNNPDSNCYAAIVQSSSRWSISLDWQCCHRSSTNDAEALPLSGAPTAKEQDWDIHALTGWKSWLPRSPSTFLDQFWSKVVILVWLWVSIRMLMHQLSKTWFIKL